MENEVRTAVSLAWEWVWENKQPHDSRVNTTGDNFAGTDMETRVPLLPPLLFCSLHSGTLADLKALIKADCHVLWFLFLSLSRFEYVEYFILKRRQTDGL